MASSYPLRLDDALKTRLETAACQDERSLNAEIVVALEDFLRRRRVKMLVNEKNSLSPEDLELLDIFDATCEQMREIGA